MRTRFAHFAVGLTTQHPDLRIVVERRHPIDVSNSLPIIGERFEQSSLLEEDAGGSDETSVDLDSGEIALQRETHLDRAAVELFGLDVERHDLVFGRTAPPVEVSEKKN